VIPIGERRKPRPQGWPGYLRIDTVHQGDQDGRKGIYHINAVDEVTQWEIVAATPQISELWLIPLLESRPIVPRLRELLLSASCILERAAQAIEIEEIETRLDALESAAEDSHGKHG
jgi:hypothetical protein